MTVTSSGSAPQTSQTPATKPADGITMSVLSLIHI